MKYMKLFEDKKEDDEIINQFELYLQELIDNGYNAYVDQEKTSLVDFEIPIIHIDKAKSLSNKKIHSFMVSINKFNTYFNIKDVIDDILVIQSYMNVEFNLIIEHLFIIGIDAENDSYLYKNIEYLPKNKNIFEIDIYFVKA